MLERFLTQSAGGGREDTEYLLEKMDRLVGRNNGHAEPSDDPPAGEPAGVEMADDIEISDILTLDETAEGQPRAFKAGARVAALQ
jgi:hypothetical protein